MIRQLHSVPQPLLQLQLPQSPEPQLDVPLMAPTAEPLACCIDPTEVEIAPSLPEAIPEAPDVGQQNDP
jgi:hypothetical protein